MEETKGIKRGKEGKRAKVRGNRRGETVGEPGDGEVALRWILGARRPIKSSKSRHPSPTPQDPVIKSSRYPDPALGTLRPC
eukprot:3886668-Rhodomonas_salina.1